VIEFEDAEHQRMMRAIAERLGFDLVSLRLELFGRKRETQAARDRAAKDKAAKDKQRSDRRAASSDPVAGTQATGEPRR